MNRIRRVEVISRVKKKSKLVRIIWTLIFACILQFAVILSLIYIEGVSDNETGTDYLVILGAGLEGETPSLSLLERLRAGSRYLREHPDTTVIVSGGQGRGEDITEAEAMRRYLVKNGIEENRIIMESRATSTMENFRYSRQLIEERTGGHVGEITFITNKYHIFRSRILARRNGLTAYALASEDFDGVWAKYLREYFAFVKSMIFDW
ncbi:MAG: YdcF family protein [Clostridiaceae bacterium]|nr:YdcF family protein [Clostridiaceae bacterium]